MKRVSSTLKSITIPSLPGVEVIAGRHITTPFRRHIHGTYIIGKVEEGQRTLFFTETTLQIATGGMFLIQPGQVHACKSALHQGHSYQILSIAPQLMQHIASHAADKPVSPPVFTQNQVWHEEEKLQFSLFLQKIYSPASEKQISRALADFLTLLLQHHALCPSSQNREKRIKEAVARAQDHIHGHYNRRLTLEELSKSACLSQFHLQREFKKDLGITPHEYLTDLRMCKAKQMILEAQDLAEVAIELGFHDQSHFAKTFKKTVGVSPKKFFNSNTCNHPLP
ncbi:helix-turn-helix transcriptional regulator [Desulfogranum japonicum]|uniref:helix-turn-helix transcriptional regulator n=1 Tax=Desulfogranum japonicum TaxID=231447 RepID=UPI0003FC008D|nr:AraC family transcriptional regulator [Desulfogranum japonicum]